MIPHVHKILTSGRY